MNYVKSTLYPPGAVGYGVLCVESTGANQWKLEDWGGPAGRESAEKAFLRHNDPAHHVFLKIEVLPDPKPTRDIPNIDPRNLSLDELKAEVERLRKVVRS